MILISLYKFLLFAVFVYHALHISPFSCYPFAELRMTCKCSSSFLGARDSIYEKDLRFCVFLEADRKRSR